MNSTKKMNVRPKLFMNRTTILSETQKIPLPTANKIVYITNTPGHTFTELIVKNM